MLMLKTRIKILIVILYVNKLLSEGNYLLVQHSLAYILTFKLNIAAKTGLFHFILMFS